MPPTTGLEGGLQLTVKDEGGPELENIILIGPGAGGTTVYSIVVYLFKRYHIINTLRFYLCVCVSVCDGCGRDRNEFAGRVQNYRCRVQNYRVRSS